MQRIRFPVIPRRKLEMLSKNTYMAKDGRFWPLLSNGENVRTFFGLRGFSENFQIFQTDALTPICDHTWSYIGQMKDNYM